MMDALGLLFDGLSGDPQIIAENLTEEAPHDCLLARVRAVIQHGGARATVALGAGEPSMTLRSPAR